MSNGYGISNWEDAKTIYSELHELTSKPIYCVTEDALKDVLDYFETKCAKSKAITTEAKQYIPGGVQHNLAFNYPFPMRARSSMTLTATSTTISCRQAVRQSSAATTLP